MKKLMLLATILIFGIISAAGQPCLPGTTYFYSQAEIDDFQANNPNCTEIEGGVHISGDDITNLNGLNVLTSIGYELWISYTSLTGLTGLDNVTFIGGTLYFRGNNDLTNLNGLHNLTTIGHNLEFWYNISLENISDLYNVTSIGGGYLTIFDNDVLQSLTGIHNIDGSSITSLYIEDNSSLAMCHVQSICDFLSQPGGSVQINDNSSGCNNQSEVEEGCDAVSIDEMFPLDYLSLYPNPASQEVNISTDDDREIEGVSIYTLTGQQVLQDWPLNGTIDVSDLQPGMYIVVVTVEGRKVRQKILVQR